jgi:hypothetical protein
LIFQLFNKVKCLTVFGASRFLFFVTILEEIEKVRSIKADVAGIAK